MSLSKCILTTWLDSDTKRRWTPYITRLPFCGCPLPLGKSGLTKQSALLHQSPNWDDALGPPRNGDPLQETDRLQLCPVLCLPNSHEASRSSEDAFPPPPQPQRRHWGFRRSRTTWPGLVNNSYISVQVLVLGKKINNNLPYGITKIVISQENIDRSRFPRPVFFCLTTFFGGEI